MNCPYCQAKDRIQTLETRSRDWGTKRIKKCLQCGNRFSTIEVYEVTDEALASLKKSSMIRNSKNIKKEIIKK